MEPEKKKPENLHYVCGFVGDYINEQPASITFRICVPRDNPKEGDDWFMCSAFDETAESVKSKQLKPGDLVELSGPHYKNKVGKEYKSVIRIHALRLIERKEK